MCIQALPLTRPAGAAEQQRRSLCPQGHRVISEVTSRQNRPLHRPLSCVLLRPGKPITDHIHAHTMRLVNNIV